ncbi:MAG: c-type cytochrome [Burkholderiales bacterium]
MMRFFALLILMLPLAAQAGDASKGETIAGKICMACHGTEGTSPLPANPNIAGQHEAYILKQLRDYRSGARENAIMAGMIAGLSDDDMRNVAAFYASRNPSRLAATDKDRAAAGRRLYRGGDLEKGIAACSGCHSPSGAGIPKQYPRIAGQHAEYTTAQLMAFRSGQRANDENEMMRIIASRLSDQEIAALAEYLSGLH